MAATPWSAAGLCGVKPALSLPVNSDMLLASITKLLRCKDPEIVVSNLSVIRKERIRSLLGKRALDI